MPKSFPLQYVDPELSITTLTIAVADDRWKASVGSSAGGGGGGVGNLQTGTRSPTAAGCILRRAPLTTTHHYACSPNGNGRSPAPVVKVSAAVDVVVLLRVPRPDPLGCVRNPGLHVPCCVRVARFSGASGALSDVSSVRRARNARHATPRLRYAHGNGDGPVIVGGVVAQV